MTVKFFRYRIWVAFRISDPAERHLSLCCRINDTEHRCSHPICFRFQEHANPSHSHGPCQSGERRKHGGIYRKRVQMKKKMVWSVSILIQLGIGHQISVKNRTGRHSLHTKIRLYTRHSAGCFTIWSEKVELICGFVCPPSCGPTARTQYL